MNNSLKLNPDTSLSQVWTEENGIAKPVKILPVSMIKNPSTVAVGPGLENKLKRFYTEAGLDDAVKETGIVNSSGNIVGFKTEQPSPKVTKMIQMVTMAGKAGTSEKVYLVAKSSLPNPIQTQQILPKIIHATPTITPTQATQRYISIPQNTLKVASSPQHHIRTAGTTTASPTISDNLSWDTSLSHNRLQQDLSDTGRQFIGYNASVIRKREYGMDSDYSDGKRPRKLEKGSKGLRHFSMKVCEKVQQKVTTSYNEVADELVTEFTNDNNLAEIDMQYDQKNIRRRVYDALNVLMAMNIISKEKKEIRWIGLPTNSAQECQLLESEIKTRREKTRQKRQQLQELMLQQIAFKNMVNRNREAQKNNGPPAPNSAIQLPFIIVNTSKKTVIDCSISNDKYEYLFNFDNTFEIHDDIEVLKRMGMAFNLDKGTCTPTDLSRAVKMVPDALKPHVIQLANQSSPLPSSSGIRPPTAHPTLPEVKRSTSPLATPLSQAEDAEVAMVTSGPSRASSTASYTGASVNTDTPSENFSDTDSDRSSPVEVV